MDDDFWKEFLLSGRAYLTVGAAGIFVVVIAFCVFPYFCRRPLPVPRLRPGGWGGREVVLAVLTHTFFAPILVLSVLTAVQFGGGVPDRIDKASIREEITRLSIVGSPLVVALTLAIVVTVMFAMSRTRPRDLGITQARWPANVILGVLMFLVMTPLALAIYFLTTWIVGNDNKNILELLVKNGCARWEWALLIFMTVVGAPLMEEIVYRGVLQGWLRRANLLGHLGLMLAVLACGSMPLASFLLPRFFDNPERSLAGALGPLFFSTALIAGYVIWLMLLFHNFLRDVDDDDDGDAKVWWSARPDWAWANARLSVYGSAMLFAMVHPWPTPIPLLLFGLAVGWLAYRTQSLIGGMVCHALFNAVACLVLYWGNTA